MGESLPVPQSSHLCGKGIRPDGFQERPWLYPQALAPSYVGDSCWRGLQSPDLVLCCDLGKWLPAWDLYVLHSQGASQSSPAGPRAL